MTLRVAAVIPAAGAGVRLRDSGGTSAPKALRLLAGRSLLERSLTTLSPVVDEVVVAAPPNNLSLVREHVQGCCTASVTVVAGGQTRQASVRAALAATSSAVDLVLVHDAARPLLPVEVARRVLSALREGAAAVVPTVPVVDSLRELRPGATSRPVNRSALRAVQTPQGFQRQVLVGAHQDGADDEATDDASLVERIGVAVTLVDGADVAFKITTPLDWLVAELLLRDGGRAQR